MRKPIAKRDDTIVEELGSETVIYEETTNQAHCLDPISSFVWRRCDGTRSIEQLRAELEEDIDQPVTEEQLHELIETMEAKGLIEVPQATPGPRDVSRRDVLRRAVVIGAVAVTIQSIVAPTPAHAASCGRGGGHRRRVRKRKTRKRRSWR